MRELHSRTRIQDMELNCDKIKNIEDIQLNCHTIKNINSRYDKLKRYGMKNKGRN
jgi:hypothetical protein